VPQPILSRRESGRPAIPSFDGLVTSSLQLSFSLPTELSLARRAFFGQRP
jgi:hypothetical protein